MKAAGIFTLLPRNQVSPAKPGFLIIALQCTRLTVRCTQTGFLDRLGLLEERSLERFSFEHAVPVEKWQPKFFQQPHTVAFLRRIEGK